MNHHIGLIVTGKPAYEDFLLFVKTLAKWHPSSTLYVYTDTQTAPSFKTIKSTLTIKIRHAMDAYQGLTRPQMEKMPGKQYDSLFKDYTYEKAAVLDWMFETQNSGVWFMDADISHLAPLPEIPAGTQLALSPHMIKAADEAKFGKYNAGFMWINDKSLIQTWRAYGKESRFYEQAALEDLKNHVSPLGFYEFPIQVNFGWWRLFQSDTSTHEIQKRFSIFRNDNSIGIRLDGKPLQSIHTHWYEEKAFESQMFRLWFDNFTKKFTAHKPIQQYRQWIGL